MKILRTCHEKGLTVTHGECTHILSTTERKNSTLLEGQP